MLVDANGDAKVDLVALNWTSTWIITSTGSGFGPPTQWSNTPFYGLVGTLSGDVNGDHKVDLVAINPLSVWVAQSTGTALSAPAMWL
jgi:VCBS repeat protein